MYLEPFYTKKERKNISCLMWGILSFLLVTSFGYTLLSWVAAQVSRQLMVDEGYLNMLACMAEYMLALPVCLLIMQKVPADPMEKSDLTLDEWFKFFCIAYFCMFAGAFISTMLADVIRELLGQAPADPLSDTTVYTSVPDFLFQLTASVLLAPVGEELIFRKFLLDRINRLGDIPAILISGLVFGLMHGNVYQFFYAATAGMLFAWIYLRTGKIRYTIFLHMAINMTTGILPIAVNTVPEGELHEICYMGYNCILFVLGAAGLIALIWMIIKKRIHFLKGWLNVRGGQIAGVTLLNSGMICFLIVIGYIFYSGL